ncbi:hypothetical protein BDW72DRAFT_199109 [Aspergillus terricola var. indicus]
MLRSSLSLAAVFAAPAVSSPISSTARRQDTPAEQCHGISGPFLSPSFPDPSILYVDNSWYSFGTSDGRDFQGAKSTEFESGWTKLDGPILATNESTWAGSEQTGSYGLWAPDVFQRSSDSRYFAALDKETIGTDSVQRCIEAPISDEIAGIYHPVTDFVQCNSTASGVIDPAWFKDTDCKQYVVYKTELPDWLEIREVSNIGPKEGIGDGNVLEAPYIFRRGDTYFLTYSTDFTGSSHYDAQYATAKSVTGPYTRVKKPLLKTTDAFGCKLTGPGGAGFQRDPQGSQDTVRVIFHGLTDELNINKRVAYTTTVKVDGDKLSIDSA